MENLQALLELERSARKRNIPVILEEGLDKLIETIKSKNPKKILEIGTAIGYSGSIMLLYAPDALLDTIEIDLERAEEARQNFKNFGLSDRIRQFIGDASLILPQLLVENDYDFVFIDGPKSKYGEYFELLEKKNNINATVFIDNLLFRGLVLNGEMPPKKYRTIVTKMRAFYEKLTTEYSRKSTVYEVGDGIAVIALEKTTEVPK